MVTKNIVKQPKSLVDVQVTLPWADIETKWNETLQRLAQDIEIAGFRKGMAPLPMVEQQLGPKVQDELLKVVMPQALIEALQGTNVVPIDYPQYSMISFQKGQDLKFTARVTERPTVTVGQYRGVKVVRPAQKEVTEEEINKIIDDLFKRWKARQPQNIVATPPNQTPVSPVTNDSQSASGASGSMSFNAPQQPAAPANPPSNSAPTSDVPDDIFAKAVGGENLTDLKAKIKTDLESENKYNNELDYEEAILQEVEKITQVDIPEILIQDELNRMLLSLQRQISDRGLLMEEYLKGQNKTPDQLKAEWRPQAEKNVRMELGLSEIARSEGVNISDEELQAEIDKIQDNRVKQQFTQQEPRMHLRHALRQTKTLNLLKGIVV